MSGQMGKIFRSAGTVYHAVQGIYGVGRVAGERVADMAGITSRVKIRELSRTQETAVQQIIDTEAPMEGDLLKREVKKNIERLIEINCYRGVRHSKKLPCRGQRTSTNAKTARRSRRKK